MNERRIEKRYEIDYRTDKKVKPCSEKTAKALEQYKEKQYIFSFSLDAAMLFTEKSIESIEISIFFIK